MWGQKCRKYDVSICVLVHYVCIKEYLAVFVEREQEQKAQVMGKRIKGNGLSIRECAHLAHSPR